MAGYALALIRMSCAGAPLQLFELRPEADIIVQLRHQLMGKLASAANWDPAASWSVWSLPQGQRVKHLRREAEIRLKCFDFNFMNLCGRAALSAETYCQVVECSRDMKERDKSDVSLVEDADLRMNRVSIQLLREAIEAMRIGTMPCALGTVAHRTAGRKGITYVSVYMACLYQAGCAQELICCAVTLPEPAPLSVTLLEEFAPAAPNQIPPRLPYVPVATRASLRSSIRQTTSPKQSAEAAEDEHGDEEEIEEGVEEEIISGNAQPQQRYRGHKQLKWHEQKLEAPPPTPTPGRERFWVEMEETDLKREMNQRLVPASFCCEECGATSTPMRRPGPSGKGSLCNACGLKWQAKEKIRLKELEERLWREAGNSAKPPAKKRKSPRVQA